MTINVMVLIFLKPQKKRYYVAYKVLHQQDFTLKSV